MTTETIATTDDNLAFAMERICDTSIHTFLTGNAGTGKSTLIRKFMEEHEGEYVALAPTGIAAVNISGMTIHSFFKFPARPVDFASIKKLDRSYDGHTLAIWRRIKYIIVDEVSMVRADIMDQIFNFCKKNFESWGHFAGKKLIMVGDIDQLPPVVASDEEKAMIKSRYKSEFFFSANCWKEIAAFSDPFEVVSLTKVWRQKDPGFIALLNNIKNNRINELDIDRLNNAAVRDGKLDPKDGVMLCTTNKIAADTNSIMIDRLEGEMIKLEGTISGEFDKKDCPVEPILLLKPGCRVMTMRNSNDPNNLYFNGTIGTFDRLDTAIVADEINGELVSRQALIILLDSGEEVTVPRYTFKNVKYQYDENSDKIKHMVIGEFVQYPIKLAYAMTIHKSQGQTFDKVIIDLGRGAFAHGQVYVALSRCRSLEGIILRRPLSKRDLIYSPTILEFNKTNKVG
jgi:ATP-dependent exoDNAse (exonuclease V) alpha subunit